mmetsp:Transcript_17254/g.37535  ORF Transcript_17254/g.37535 Transcript_17254/m.37535 type:complete len:226 (-) Transcript_17254:503-1180(-)
MVSAAEISAWLSSASVTDRWRREGVVFLGMAKLEKWLVGGCASSANTCAGVQLPPDTGVSLPDRLPLGSSASAQLRAQWDPSSGIAVKSRSPSPRRSNLGSPQNNSSGMGPLSWFSDNSRTRNRVSVARLAGSVPESEFCARSRTSRCESLSKLLGKPPVKLLFRSSSARIGPEEMLAHFTPFQLQCVYPVCLASVPSCVARFESFSSQAAAAAPLGFPWRSRMI